MVHTPLLRRDATGLADIQKCATAFSHNRPLERRNSVFQARRLTRCHFCRADEEPAAPEP